MDKLAGELCPALLVGEGFFLPELLPKVVLVIAGEERQVKVGEGLAVCPAEDAEGDELVVDDRIGLIRADGGGGQQSQSSGK